MSSSFLETGLPKFSLSGQMLILGSAPCKISADHSLVLFAINSKRGVDLLQPADINHTGLGSPLMAGALLGEFSDCESYVPVQPEAGASQGKGRGPQRTRSASLLL